MRHWVRPRHGLRTRLNLTSCYLIVKFSGFLKAFSAQRIDGHIGHNPVEPGIKRCLPLEPVNRAPRLQESFLRQIPGVLLILDHSVNHGKDLAPIFDDQLFESEWISFLTSPN